MLGILKAELQELQVWPPQEGIVVPYGVKGTIVMEQLLRAEMANTIVLLEGALTTESEEDRAVVGRIKGLGLNLATLCGIHYISCRTK